MGDRGGFLRRADGFATKTIHVGQNPDDWPNGPLVTPLLTTTTYKHKKAGEFKYNYGRLGNPTRSSLQECLAALEDTKYAVTFSSGLGAVSAITNIFNTGSHFVVSKDIYGGTMQYFDVLARRIGMEPEFIDVSDLTLLDKSIKKTTKLVWLESPTNPTMRVLDIQAICQTVHKHPGVIVVVDNTFLTSYLQRPLDLGADISMYSLTKFMNGHSDVIMGGAVTKCEKLYKELSYVQKYMGLNPSPFDCHQMMRSLKTLSLRMDQHHKSSLKIAEFLEQHEHVAKVFHPGMPSHPQHKLALKQCYGHSGIMSFEIKGGLKETDVFFANLKLFCLAASLGGPESLACHPARMTHDTVSVEQRKRMGVTDALIRISVGLESVDELIHDLDQALNTTFK